MHNGTLVSIIAREVWDVPRIFVAHFGGHSYLFDSPFDDKVEDYLDTYRVYELPPLTTEDLQGSWIGLPKRAYRFLGDVPVKKVSFDQTRRQFIHQDVLVDLLQRAPAGSLALS